MIKPIRELVQIQRQILGRNLVVNAGDRPLEQGPDILNPVNMNIPGLHIVFSGMVHGIMDKFRAIEPQVRAKFIGMDFRAGQGVFADETPQGAGFDIINRFHKDFA